MFALVDRSTSCTTATKAAYVLQGGYDGMILINFEDTDNKLFGPILPSSSDFVALFSSSSVGVSLRNLLHLDDCQSAAPNPRTMPANTNGTGTGADNLAGFSSQGPTADGRAKPDVTAPGDEILSAFGRTTGSLIAKDGTSQATPAAAGNVALLREYFVRGFHHDGSANLQHSLLPMASLLRATVIAAAAKMQGYAGSTPLSSLPVPNVFEGYGRLSLQPLPLGANGKGMAVLSNEDLSVDNTTQLLEGCVERVESNLPITLVLAWTDYPGAPQATIMLVSDLDLLAHGVNGSVWGNQAVGNLFLADGLNNNERVSLSSQRVGWQVSASALPQGSQSFSLVALNARVISRAACDTDGLLPSCPGNCTGRGTCQGHRCLCQFGWSGRDCSHATVPVALSQQPSNVPTVATVSWEYATVSLNAQDAQDAGGVSAAKQNTPMIAALLDPAATGRAMLYISHGAMAPTFSHHNGTGTPTKLRGYQEIELGGSGGGGGNLQVGIYAKCCGADLQGLKLYVGARKACPGDCSGAGTCRAMDGVCFCQDPLNPSPSCSTTPPALSSSVSASSHPIFNLDVS